MHKSATPAETLLVPIAPGYRQWSPPSSVARAVDCLWTFKAAPESTQESLVLPDGRVDVIWQLHRGAFLAGPDTGPVHERIPPDTVLVAVRFRPGAGGPALGVPLAEIRDLRVDLVELRPDLAELLPQDLPPELASSRILDLTQRVCSQMEEDAMVIKAALLVTQAGVRVEALAGELGVSPRQLRRRFDAAVGYGPKTLQRVLRFQSLLTSLSRPGELPGLADLALRCGYWDQAHMSRECAGLAGLTPAQLALRARGSGTGDGSRENGSGVVSR